MCRWVKTWVAFGRPLAEMGQIRQNIARSRSEIAQIKVVAPSMALKVIDRAIQAQGGMGVCDEVWLAAA